MLPSLDLGFAGGSAAPSSSSLSFYDDASIVFGNAEQGGVEQSPTSVSTSANPNASNAAYIPASSLGYTTTSSNKSILWIGLLAAAALAAWFMFKK